MKSNIDASWSYCRYQEVRHRFPNPVFPVRSDQIANLGVIAEGIDAFVFDAFGVLNVSETSIATAVDRLTVLRAMGKKVRVLTNAASLPMSAACEKFASLGYDFSEDEIVSSRQVLISALQDRKLDGQWGCIAPPGAPFDDLPVDAIAFDPKNDGFAGIIFLGGASWDTQQNKALTEWLSIRSVPFLVGNPDIVAPRGDWFSLEPGAYAHDIADQAAGTPEFFGKPFRNAFEAVAESIGHNVPRDKVLMVGDTLHTDILGGAAAGFKTCLVTSHGVLRDLDHMACIADSGIVPDYIVPTI